MRIARVACRHHAIEHVDAAAHGLDDILGPAHAHQITRTIDRQQRHGFLERAVALGLGFADGETADGVTVETDLDQPFGGYFAQLWKCSALHDAEQRIGIDQIVERAALRSAQRSDSSIESRACFSVAGYGVHSSKIMAMSESSVRWMRIDSSGDRNTREPSTGEAKLTPSSLILRRSRQREHLKAAGIGEDRFVPADEAVQAAELADHVEAGAQEQMERVAEDDFRAGFDDRSAASSP